MSAGAVPPRGLSVPAVDEYVCSSCGAAGRWGSGWHWYGSVDGPPIRIYCPACSAEKIDLREVVE